MAQKFNVTFSRTFTVEADDWTEAENSALDVLVTEINEWGVSKDVFDVNTEEVETEEQ